MQRQPVNGPRRWGRLLGMASCWLALVAVGRASAAELAVKRTDQSIAVYQDGRPVLAYNLQSPPVPQGVDPAYQRSGFLHPVLTPKGRAVTATFPADHPHQHGIFTAWVKTTYAGKAVDFWNLAGGTGRVLHERVVSTFSEKDRCGFEVDLLHRATIEPPVDVLRERWKVTVYDTQADYYCFDIETTQQALTQAGLIVHQHHYGGFALRGPTRWLSSKDSDGGGPASLEASAIVNNHGSDRIDGNLQHAKWVALSGAYDGEPVSVTVLCHSDNPHAPQAARLHPTKPYFCFAACADGEFVIDRDHPYRATYRILVTDAQPQAGWLDELWAKWCKEMAR